MIRGEETMRIVVVVPKDILELTLYMGSYNPKTFEVDDETYETLMEQEKLF